MKIKKIIAREFLFLLTTLVLIGLTFIGLKIYNASRERKIESIKTEAKLVENKYKSFLSQPLKTKDSTLNQSCLNRIIDFYKANKEVVNYNAIYKNFPELKSDSVLLNASFDYNATINSGKYKSLKEVNLKFPEFFIVNKSDIDSLSYYKAQIELLQKDITFSTNDILNYLYVVGFWLLIIAFGLRYLFYSTKWAIQTIKTKE
uniref:hypothetical protein n=1 Tax=Gelidibacter sp. TaxID=2018083 RepID=UPI00404943BC